MRSKLEILDELKTDLEKNINMINFIECYPIDRIVQEGASILVRGKSDENWCYISSDSSAELRVLIEKCEGEKYFAVVENWMLPYICQDKEIEWQLSCMKLVFPNDYTLGQIKHEAVELTSNDAEYIYQHSKYKAYTSLDYIKERIAFGIAFGIYEDKKLVAWIMTHDDGAIGFLNVLEEYRNRGYGFSLTVAAIKRLREIGKVPFVHIEDDNVESLNLARKIGFIGNRKVHWIKLKE